MTTPTGYIIPASADYGWPQLNVRAEKLEALTKSCMEVPVRYGLGAKANPLASQIGQFTRIDCSGYARWGIAHSLAANVPTFSYHDFQDWMPDGSWNENHEWCQKIGFKPSTYGDATRHDNVLRVFYLEPSATVDGIGHTGFVLNGMTLESHGGKGVDMREWGSHSWMSHCELYVLKLADAA